MKKYMFKYLGKRMEGEIIKLNLNKNNIKLSIINERLKVIPLNINHKNSCFMIPENGLWILKCIDEKVENAMKENELELKIVISNKIN